MDEDERDNHGRNRVGFDSETLEILTLAASRGLVTLKQIEGSADARRAGESILAAMVRQGVMRARVISSLHREIFGRVQSTFSRKEIAPRRACSRSAELVLRNATMPAIVKLAWIMCALVLVAVSILQLAPRLGTDPAPSARRPKTKSAPTGRSARADEEARRVHHARLRRLDELKSAGFSSAVLAFIQDTRTELGGTECAAVWKQLEAEYVRGVESSARDSLDPLVREADELARKGRYGDAVRKLDLFPQNLRALGPDRLTGAEERRREALSEWAAQANKGAPMIAARIEQAMGDLDFDGAWVLAAELDRAGDPMWAAAMRLKILGRWTETIEADEHAVELKRRLVRRIGSLGAGSPEVMVEVAFLNRQIRGPY